MTHFSRSDWGARAAKSGPGPLVASRVDGLAFHWPAMSKPLATVAAVKAALRGWQNFHMDDKGWSDIGYQVAIDQAGNRYDLRGLRTQSGANGDQDVNQRFGAVLLILAPGEQPSAKMIAEARAVVTDFRKLFPDGRRIVGHGQIRPEPTACPGPAAQKAVNAGTFEPAEPTKAPTVNQVQTSRAQIEQGLALIRKGQYGIGAHVAKSRVAVWAMRATIATGAAIIRRALKAGPKS